MPDVSFIIVNWNGKDLLRDCLHSLRTCTLTTEIIVADNGSTDGSVPMVQTEFPDVTLLRYERNERFAKPNNDGMAAATGQYLFLLNNDTVVHAGAVERMVDALDHDAALGMVGARLIGTDGDTQHSCHGIVSLRTHLFDMTGLDRLFPTSHFFASGPATYIDYSNSQEVDHLMAAAVLVRREAVEEVGMFDESLTIYYNDLDWSLRFKQAGWKTWYCSDAAITHIGGATTRTLRFDPDIVREQYRNIMTFYRKHYGAPGLVLYRFMLCLGFIPRLLYWTIRNTFAASGEMRWRMFFSAWSIRIAVLGA